MYYVFEVTQGYLLGDGQVGDTPYQLSDFRNFDSRDKRVSVWEVMIFIAMKVLEGYHFEMLSDSAVVRAMLDHIRCVVHKRCKNSLTFQNTRSVQFGQGA